MLNVSCRVGTLFCYSVDFVLRNMYFTLNLSHAFFIWILRIFQFMVLGLGVRIPVAADISLGTVSDSSTAKHSVKGGSVTDSQVR